MYNEFTKIFGKYYKLIFAFCLSTNYLINYYCYILITILINAYKREFYCEGEMYMGNNQNIHNTWITNEPIAHRGIFDNETVAENSLPAYKACIERGCPIEIDVRVTKDKKVVVFHDDKLCRMTDIDGYVSHLTYEEIRHAKLLKTNDTIPTLQEVLALVNGSVPLLIEIKNIGGVSYEKELYEILKDYKGEYAIQSFSPLILEWFKLNAPSVKRGQLASFFKGEKGLNPIAKYSLKRLKLNKRSDPDFISYKLEDLPNKYVKKANLPVIAWTITSNEEIARAKEVADNYIFQM